MSTQRPTPDPIRRGQQSVWSYPRPARLERNERHIVVVFDGRVVAETSAGFRVIETSHPPTYYLPPDDIDLGMVRRVPGRGSFCEWKGYATYFDVVTESQDQRRACWTYLDPSPSFVPMTGHVAFYAAMMAECRVDGEVAKPQQGAFYGGWITSHVAGPFKGPPGTEYW
ncbi:MAG: hypothetical protein ACI9OJ_005200 [Myxococcota bacterium]|jgi:uncharacterized protein (DUF427 family)